VLECLSAELGGSLVGLDLRGHIGLAVRTHRPRERLLSPSGDGGPNRQKRAAVIGLAPKPKGRVYEVAELLRDTTLAVWASARWHDSSSAAAEC
jgi:hypothetical protein